MLKSIKNVWPICPLHHQYIRVIRPIIEYLITYATTSEIPFFNNPKLSYPNIYLKASLA
ncbi:unnamed protein product, partial [Dovyalis caffra]